MKKLLFLLLGTSTLCIINAAERDIALRTATGALYGTLMVPDTDAKSDVAVLLICGSGPTDRNGNNPQMNNNSIRLLADAICKAGYASLRYDKRGIAASHAAAPQEEDLRFTTYVDDARAWIDTLATLYSKIVVMGHSEGAQIGTMAATAHPKVAGVVLVAGAGRCMDVVLREQLSTQPDAVRDAAYPILDALKEGKTVDRVPQMLAALFRPSVQPYLISCFAADPADAVARLAVPTLIIQGDTDIQIKVADAELLHAARPDAKVVVIKEMNHVLKSCTSTDMQTQMFTYTNPALPLKQELATTLTAFLDTLASR